MRITFRRVGAPDAFFPGLMRPFVLDTENLEEEERRHLAHLVEASRFFDQPAETDQPPPQAVGYLEYTVTVVEHYRSHTVRLSDFTADADLQALLAFLRRRAKRG
jgi:hypothetical protein